MRLSTGLTKRRFLGAAAASAVLAGGHARADEHKLAVASPLVQLDGRFARPMDVRDRMRFFKTPGVSLAFIENGQVHATECLGTDGGEGLAPVTPTTLFQGASMSKPLSATAALRLVAAGRLSLDEDLIPRLTRWGIAGPHLDQGPITLRRVLSHTAGFGHNAFPGRAPAKPFPSTEDLLLGRPPADNAPIQLQQAPGVAFHYSNDGFVVLQRLLEEATDRPFPDLMRRLLLQPLEMGDTTFDQTLPPKLSARASLGHGWGGTVLPERRPVHPDMAGGGVWTTPSDMARFVIAIQHAHRGGRGAILPRELAQAALTPSEGPWGLGFGLGSQGQSPRFRQSGSNEGYQCGFEGLLDRPQGIVVMTNAVAANLLVPELLHGAAELRGWTEPPAPTRTQTPLGAEALQAFVGSYVVADYQIAEVRRLEGMLQLRTPFFGDDWLELAPLGDDKFLIWETHSVEVGFERDALGAVRKIAMHYRIFGVSGDRRDGDQPAE